MVKESLDNILKTLGHNEQSRIRSILYIVVEQVILELLHNDIIGETLDTQMAPSFDTDALNSGCRRGC